LGSLHDCLADAVGDVMSGFDLDEFADERDLELLRIDGFDDCCVGIVDRCGEQPVLCYSKRLMVQKLVKEMGYDDAVEHFEFNIAGAYMGPLTPYMLEEFDEQAK
jgi:hypothetical protein